LIIVSTGWLSQHLLARGVGTRLARGVPDGGGVAFGGMCLALMESMPGDHLKIAMVVLGIAVPGVIYTLGHTIVSEITPVPQRAAMLAIHNAVITSAGLIGPYVMGSVVQIAGASPAEGYHRGFLDLWPGRDGRRRCRHDLHAAPQGNSRVSPPRRS
jgi:hypothetical protein